MCGFPYLFCLCLNFKRCFFVWVGSCSILFLYVSYFVFVCGSSYCFYLLAFCSSYIVPMSESSAKVLRFFFKSSCIFASCKSSTKSRQFLLACCFSASLKASTIFCVSGYFCSAIYWRSHGQNSKNLSFFLYHATK